MGKFPKVDKNIGFLCQKFHEISAVAKTPSGVWMCKSSEPVVWSGNRRGHIVVTCMGWCMDAQGPESPKATQRHMINYTRATIVNCKKPKGAI